ncbi:MAG: hypothetical protein KGM24_06590 [Elusimicrobia bacterium]|nr:hypothetical protein [Elusimicrobiota bacterium]
MATKAQMARYWSERAGPKKARAPRRLQDVLKAGKGWNYSERAGRHASYALETSAGTPSRRSTRASQNRQKPTGLMKGLRARAKPR